MTKLTTLLAIATMSMGLGLTGCKTDPEKSKEAPVAKPTDKPADPPKPEDKPTEVKPEDTKPQPTASADLPAECADYKAAIEKLATCNKLPQQTRDALKQAFDSSSTAWATVPTEGKAALRAACKSAADGIKASAAACQ